MEKEGGKEEGRKREREREGMPDESEWYARSGARSLSSSFVLSLRPGPTHYPPSLESIYPRPRPADRADPIPSLPLSLSAEARDGGTGKLIILLSHGGESRIPLLV